MLNESNMDYWQNDNVSKTKMKEIIPVVILQHQILKVQTNLNHDEYYYYIKQFVLT